MVVSRHVVVDWPVVCRQVIGGGAVCRYAVIFYAVNVDVVVAEHEHAGVEVIDAGQEVKVVGTGHVGVLAGHHSCRLRACRK